MTPDDQRYFDRIDNELKRAREVARRAKQRGDDPRPEVEIPVAKDMADRVENILEIDGIAARIRTLETETDLSRGEIALELVADFVDDTVGDYETDAGKIEGAVRTAVALLTEGVVAAPIEGIDRVTIDTNDNGTSFVTVYYAGPIRSAGGTAQALSVLVADYARSLLGVDRFLPRDAEIERYVEEVRLYDDETGLQYSPKDKEVAYIVEHCPIRLDGEATGDEEVSGYRDLDRIDTNASRGGMCLVLAEGIALKAPKIKRYTDALEAVAWPWLDELIDGTVDETATDTDAAAGGTEPTAPGGEPPRTASNSKYLRDLIAGRPVFSHPSATGGFRLRYGRTRNLGHATAGVHPATMHIVDDFLAPGTQLKTELPGKAAGVVPVDSIEGPTVKLANGEVRRIDDAETAKELRNGVEQIVDLGEYLVNYGEFVENNQPLAPAAYAVEWWEQDLAAAGADIQALADDPTVDLRRPAVQTALHWASEFDAPLHPAYTYLWHDLTVDEFQTLAAVIGDGQVIAAAAAEPTADVDLTTAFDVPQGDVLLLDAAAGSLLTTLLVEHVETETSVLVPTWRPLVRSMGFSLDLGKQWETLPQTAREWPNAMQAVEAVAPFSVRERAPTRVGNRMGRPEKSEVRELNPAVHTLFPIGDAGGDQRDVGAAATHTSSMQAARGAIDVEVGIRHCPDCDVETHWPRCPECNAHIEPRYTCPDCDRELHPDDAGRVTCTHCETTGSPVQTKTIDLHDTYRSALTAVSERETAFEILKGVKGLSSSVKTPEPLEKGILRAKHDVSVFKDGTVRYDMTDLPVTAVTPAELNVAPTRLRELGYTEDIHGDPLRHDDQLIELNVQDIVLSNGAAEHMYKTANFVDDLLRSYYGLDPYYKLEEPADVVGELVFGMAPHTSAAVVGRVVGIADVSAGYAHPYFHAAKRRNCFHPETKLWYNDQHGWHYDTIEQFVESKLEAPETDDFGTLIQKLDHEIQVPSIDGDGTDVCRPIDAVSKHVAPDHLVEIETRSGRQLRVTPDHAMLRWTDAPERVDAKSIAEGDYVPTPKSIPAGEAGTRLDILAELLAADAVAPDEIIVHDLEATRLETLLEDVPADTTAVTRRAPSSKRQPVDATGGSHTGIPAGALCALAGGVEALLSALPADVRISLQGDTATLNRYVTVDEQLGGLLGYYTASGGTRKQEDTGARTTISVSAEQPRGQVARLFKQRLGADTVETATEQVTVSSRLVAVLLVEVFELGASARERQIPDAIVSGPNTVLRAFLGAYFDSERPTSGAGRLLRTHVVSHDLKTDLEACLKRFGIAAQTQATTDIPTGARGTDPDGDPPAADTWVLTLTAEHAATFQERIGFGLDRAPEKTPAAVPERQAPRQFGDGGTVWLDEVTSVTVVESDVSYTYSLTVDDTHTLVANDIYSAQCDGDEDCVMLLMDGLLNFSKSFLPDQRGGRMDAPLVMSSRIDPAEIDDEAHNVDTMTEYPKAFYEATRELAHPDAVTEMMTLAGASVGTDTEYHGFAHTHETSDIAAGPDLSAYKTLEGMPEKTDAQLQLARRLRAVDATDVAERIIEYHFLPDLLGNLRAFSRQEFRCLDCGTDYRRPPLTGSCRGCGGNVTLTVHEGSVTKYLDTAITIAEEYEVREYTQQRLEVLKRSIDRIFEDDTNRQTGIADFM